MKLLLNMPVRRASVLGVLVLVLAFVTLAWQTLQSYSDVELSLAESRSIAGLNILSQGMTDFSLERGAATYQVAATLPLDPVIARRLPDNRVKSDRNFETVRQISASHEQTAAFVLFRTEFERVMRDIATLRGRVDQQLALPYPARDSQFVADVAELHSKALRELEGLRLLLNEPQARITFQTRALLDLSRTAWKMREVGGIQRTMFSVSISNRQPMTQETIDLVRSRGALVAVTNESARQILAIGGFPPAVTAAFDAVQEAYFGTYQRLKDRLCDGAVTGTYDISFPDFVAQSDAPLRTVEALVRVSLDAALEAIAADAAASQYRLYGGLAALSVVTLGMVWLAWLLRVRVAQRLQAMADVTRGLAAGDLNQDLERFASADEVGQLAAGIGVLRDAARERLRLEAATGVEQAERQRRSDALARLADRFAGEVRTSLDGVTHASSSLRDTASGLSAGAMDAAAQASSVSSSADLASANVQTVAAAAEELSSSIQEITRQITRSAAVASQAVGEAAATTTAVTELADATARIDDVVRLISDIAGRTNLLALNATIEAARAGDAGKGFAVVASEVKSLATQTARATDDIATQISAMQGVAERAVAAIRRIDETIGSMNEISTAIAASMEEQGQATAEIARNVQEAAASTSSMTGSLLTVTGAIARSTEASGKVLTAAEAMAASSQAIQTRVDRYFAEMKAA